MPVQQRAETWRIFNNYFNNKNLLEAQFHLDNAHGFLPLFRYSLNDNNGLLEQISEVEGMYKYRFPSSELTIPHQLEAFVAFDKLSKDILPSTKTQPSNSTHNV